MIFHSELSKEKREGGLENAVYDITQALNRHTDATHARLGDHYPSTLKGVQMFHFHGLWSQDHIELANLCMQNGIPYIVSPHGMLEPWALGHKRLKKWIHRKLYTDAYLNEAEYLLATSAMECRNIQKLFPKQRVLSIPLGIKELPEVNYAAARESCAIAPEVFHLLYLSRIDVKKNLHLLLNALPQIAEKIDRPIQLTIIGDGSGPYFLQCMELARMMRSKHIHISIQGPIWDESKWDWLAASDLFCLPSSSENFGYVYLESLATGTPILTTQHTPWVDHAGEPFVHVCKTDKNSIAESVLQAYQQTRSAGEREQARSFVVNNFLWETLAPQYASLYPHPSINEKNPHPAV